MAGRISIRFAMSPRATYRFTTFWTTGRGGTIGIKWGTRGDLQRCQRHMIRLFPRPGDARGICQSLQQKQRTSTSTT